MTGPIAYLNGRFVPKDQCLLPMYDAGIVLGAAVTDLVRTFAGQPFAAGEHIDRFLASARYAYLELPVSRSQLLEIVQRVIDHNYLVWDRRDLAVILYATAGQFTAYAGSAASPPSGGTLVVHSFPLPLNLWRSAMIDGVHVITPTQRHIHPNTLSSKIKHRNRLHMWIGDQQARLVDPAAIGLYLDTDGNITETGGANFLIYRQGTISSPHRTNILWGVTLEHIVRIGREFGVAFAERDLQIHDVVNAEEAWLATTPYVLAPVVRINGIPIGEGQPGPVWRQLLGAFGEEVGLDVWKQIVEFTEPLV